MTQNWIHVGRVMRVRLLCLADADISVAWRNSPEVSDCVLGYRFPVTTAAETEWVKQIVEDKSRSRVVLAIEPKSEDGLIGYCYLNGIDWFNHVAEFGILIGEERWRGKGIGIETSRFLCRYAFETLNLERLHLRVAEYNVRAVSMYERIGFVREGAWRNHVFRGGARHDVILMGLLRSEWQGEISPLD
jgi:RimJ/RimL family protein N-acetyltransferase